MSELDKKLEQKSLEQRIQQIDAEFKQVTERRKALADELEQTDNLIQQLIGKFGVLKELLDEQNSQQEIELPEEEIEVQVDQETKPRTTKAK